MLKQKIMDKENIPPEAQRIIVNGKELDDEKTLGEYNISQGSTVYLLLKLVPVGNFE
jgi:ubiquitin C